MASSALNEKLNKLSGLFEKQDSTSKLIQIKLATEIMNYGSEGEQKLLGLLLQRSSSEITLTNYVDGVIYELLLKSYSISIKSVLQNSFPTGIVPLNSDLNINYTRLQKLLIEKKFQKADSLTQALLCELSQAINGHSRPWLYFTDISSLPGVDLHTIDQLWQIHSNGLFGLSIQRKIWLANNTNWEKFWNKIGWTTNNITRRYPQEFTWNLNAPEGHLPLFNQLRGVQVLVALFEHPVWLD